MQHVTHPGCNPQILERLNYSINSNELVNFPEENVNPILDLMDSLNSAKEGIPPLSGRTHDLVGWLAQPKERWPNFTRKMVMAGDEPISERLASGRSGFHPDLR